MGFQDSALRDTLAVTIGLTARTSSEEMLMWTAFELAYEKGRGAGLTEAKQAMEAGMATGGVVDRANAGFEEARVDDPGPGDAAKLEQEFEELCRRHDLTYVFSDDGRAYRRGAESMNAIIKMAERLDNKKACEIWNKVVDERIVGESRGNYYWTPK